MRDGEDLDTSDVFIGHGDDERTDLVVVVDRLALEGQVASAGNVGDLLKLITETVTEIDQGPCSQGIPEFPELPILGGAIALQLGEALKSTAPSCLFALFLKRATGKPLMIKQR